MKLISNKFANLIEWDSEKVLLIKIENQKFLSDFLFYLSRCDKVSEECLRIYNDKGMELTKDIEIILEPFSLTTNNKLVLKFIKDSFNKAVSESLIELNQLVLPLWDFYQSILVDIPIDVMLDNELVTRSLTGLYKIEIEDSAENLLELLTNYIKTIAGISKTRTFIFNHLKHYLTEKELRAFYEACRYEEVNLILIESTMGKTNGLEHVFILDEDLCEIF